MQSPLPLHAERAGAVVEAHPHAAADAFERACQPARTSNRNTGSSVRVPSASLGSVSDRAAGPVAERRGRKQRGGRRHLAGELGRASPRPCWSVRLTSHIARPRESGRHRPAARRP